MSRRTNRLYFACALLGMGANIQPASASAEEVADHLARRWFEIELILFERLPVLDVLTNETLVARSSRSWPADLLALQPPLRVGQDNLQASATEYDIIDHGSERCLGYPLLPEPDPINRSPHLAGPPVPEPPLDQMGPPLPPPTEQPILPDRLPPPLLSAPLEQTVESGPTPYDLVLEDIAAWEQTLLTRAYVLSGELTMVNEVKAINRQRHLRPLLHQRWLQPVPPRESPLPIMITTPTDETAPATVEALAKVEGHIAITVGRYLHAAPTLWYHADNLGRAPITFPAVQAEPLPMNTAALAVHPPYMELQESRRMRSTELHYLDHPKIGLILRIDPVEPPQALTLELQAALSSDEIEQQ